MSLENGFLVFNVQPSAKFERSAKVLKKSFKSKRQEQAFVDCVTAIVRSLVQEPQDPGECDAAFGDFHGDRFIKVAEIITQG